MRTKVGVVNVFDAPYEVWTTRKTSLEEATDLVLNHGFEPRDAFNLKDKLIETISSHAEAAAYMLRKRADNGLAWHIEQALEASDQYEALQSLMPPEAPEALESYQAEFSEEGLGVADEAIQTHGVEMAEGQLLFHGGHWAGDDSTLTTSRPFSTSFCPQVALRNAEHNNKAYEAGRVDLMVISVKQSTTKAYAYGRRGDHAHEKEVVFASGAQLTRVRETYIADVPVSRAGPGYSVISKVVPGYLLEVELT